MAQTRALYEDLEKILLTADQIREAVEKLGRRITEEYRGKDLVLVCTLKGACVFFADLLRAIELPLTIDFVCASSYANTESTGKILIRKDLDCDVRGRDVILVEDIVDTGRTLAALKKLLSERGADSVRIAGLLNKKERRTVDLEPDYSCFEIPEGFVVGYGLDYNEQYRGLPDIGILKASVYSGH